LPMAQLAHYVSDLAALLGQEEHVHLIEIRESSTVLVPIVDQLENVIQQLRDVPTPNIDNIDPFAILAALRGDDGKT